ncbi:serine/threonine-protein kinase [Streptomyces sp. NPDC051773]|uniref:serine/threonine-protein kinase n=1 Tax=Streptomyces sp. NPDC051773 TaxID=3156682 RepID=UPI0034319C82
MSDQRPVPPPGSADRVPALRQAGALPLRPGDPDRIGPYVSLGLLGSGGMGRVYLARPADGGPDLVAVKVIRPEYAEDERFRRRFEREASVHGRVRTPRMPRLAGTGFRDELLWMATEFLPGLDLAAAVHEDGPLPVVAVRRLVAELGRALADLSAAGIVHRDLKPSNILLSAWGAHVIDFGIAKAADASAITGTGNRVGTPAYMSPEYLRTGACDTASDVFSLACALVFAATGSAPFGDGTGVDVMHRVAFEEPNPKVLAEIAQADAPLATLLTACLAKEPDQRPTPIQLIETMASAGSGAQPSLPAEGRGELRDQPPPNGRMGVEGAQPLEADGTGRGGGGERSASDTPPGHGPRPPHAFDWPEPLAGRVLARQRAYEALRRLPLEQPAPARAAGPAPDTDAPPSPPAAPSAQPSAPTPLRSRLRSKRVLVGAAGVAVCTATAGVVVLTLLSPATTTASPQRGTTRSADALPDEDAPVSAASRRDGADAAPDGGSSDSEVSGKDERTSVDGERESPDATASAPGKGTGEGTDDDQRSDPSAPASGSGAPTEPSEEPTDTSTEPSTPAWLTDCTYYYGNGRTRLGDSGDRVLQAQCMLSKRGYVVDVDGDFDADTEAAVQSFQQDKGLLAADGVVRPRVWKALRSTE